MSILQIYELTLKFIQIVKVIKNNETIIFLADMIDQKNIKFQNHFGRWGTELIFVQQNSISITFCLL